MLHGGPRSTERRVHGPDRVFERIVDVMNVKGRDERIGRRAGCGGLGGLGTVEVRRRKELARLRCARRDFKRSEPLLSFNGNPRRNVQGVPGRRLVGRHRSASGRFGLPRGGLCGGQRGVRSGRLCGRSGLCGTRTGVRSIRSVRGIQDIRNGRRLRSRVLVVKPRGQPRRSVLLSTRHESALHSKSRSMRSVERPAAFDPDQ